MAERQIQGNPKSNRPPTNMTGQGNEIAKHGRSKKEDEEAPKEMEVDTGTPVKTANSKGKRSESSDPVDDDSEKNNIDDDVPLSFPQRVSCCMSGSSVTSCLL
jgi:hypothetical protein